MMPRSTTTSITAPRYPIKNTLSYNNQKVQQQPVRNANTSTNTGSSLNSHHGIDGTEPCRTAFDLMSTRLLQSERNRNAAHKNNSTIKK
jgi:hypothetical protein